MIDYGAFLHSKRHEVVAAGPVIEPGSIHATLFSFQRDLVRWAVRKGRSALFADTGLGKTFMQLEWARLIGEPALIVAPLSVARQTIREAATLGTEVGYSRDGQPAGQITITNYEMVEHFDPAQFGAVVLDESSILKALDGKTRRRLTEMFAATPYRLCCTATPAPNDIAEIGNHAEFLGIMTNSEMLSAFFVHGSSDDKGGKDGWRLKGHAEDAFFRWLATWGMAIRTPSDIGYSDEGYALPPLDIRPEFLPVDYVPDGQLFFGGLKGITDRSRVRRATVGARVERTVGLVLNSIHADIARTERVQPTMAGVPQGPRSGVPREDEGSPQRPTPGDVRHHARASRQDADRGKGLAGGEPGEAQDAATSGVRDDLRGLHSADDIAAGTLRDLRPLRYVEPQDVPGSGSRSQDGPRSWPAVHELQPGTGQVSGRPGAIACRCGVPHEQWLIWCGLNDEQDRLARLLTEHGIPFETVFGALSPEEKMKRVERWQDGHSLVMVSKPSVLGFGMNFQNAHRMAFVGLSDSWEAYYQSIRRCWRFGQKESVEVVIVLSEAEAAIYENVMEKEREARQMQERLIEHVAAFEREELVGAADDGFDYRTATHRRPAWTMMLGDSVERLREIETASVDLSVFSPPFRSLFTYSPSERDIGNAASRTEFDAHFGYLIDEILRVTKPGRNVACHVQQVPTTMAHDGATGLSDFRGDVVRMFIGRGWTFHGEVTIDKDPQAQAIRTKAKGLLFVQKERDRSWLRPAFADYILVFRKPGDNAVPIRSDEVSNDDWIEWARPIWYGIRESETLNAAEAREQKDERHIAALQLETVRRCVKLWSNPGDLVLDPFAGIGTTGYVAVQNGRHFVGCELKQSYFEAACRNIERASNVMTLGLPMGG